MRQPLVDPDVLCTTQPGLGVDHVLELVGDRVVGEPQHRILFDPVAGSRRQISVRIGNHQVEHLGIVAAHEAEIQRAGEPGDESLVVAVTHAVDARRVEQDYSAVRIDVARLAEVGDIGVVDRIIEVRGDIRILGGAEDAIGENVLHHHCAFADVSDHPAHILGRIRKVRLVDAGEPEVERVADDGNLEQCPGRRRGALTDLGQKRCFELSQPKVERRLRGSPGGEPSFVFGARKQRGRHLTGRFAHRSRGCDGGRGGRPHVRRCIHRPETQLHILECERPRHARRHHLVLHAGRGGGQDHAIHGRGAVEHQVLARSEIRVEAARRGGWVRRTGRTAAARRAQHAGAQRRENEECPASGNRQILSTHVRFLPSNRCCGSLILGEARSVPPGCAAGSDNPYQGG